MLFKLVCVVSLVALSLCQIPDEDWGYVTARPGAHMFWWLYGSFQTPREKQPLILWLQGGPGGSSTGFGNFGELGPLDVNLQPRNTSWVYAANVLFIDNPVGTGYSYVDSPDKLTTNNDQIAADLVTIFSAFLDAYPVFKTIPFYVFCESYGGKMTTGFANALLDAIHSGKVSSNFSGIALGDSWISPMDYVNTWGPLLYSMSLVDKHQLDRINVAAAATQQAVDNGQWNNATDLWGTVENVVEAVSANTDFYNILSRELPNQNQKNRVVKNAHRVESPIETLRRIHLGPLQAGDPLDDLMNKVIRQKLNSDPKKGKVIPDSVTWGSQAGDVFSALSGDFMRPVVSGKGSVDNLLQQNFPVTVYTGQLDLICCTLGTDLWMHRLTWSGMPNFFESPKIEHDMPNQPGVLGGFSKSYRNLRMWYIMMAGHMVPADNGPMALAMVRAITGTK